MLISILCGAPLGSLCLQILGFLDLLATQDREPRGFPVPLHDALAWAVALPTAGLRHREKTHQLRYPIELGQCSRSVSSQASRAIAGRTSATAPPSVWCAATRGFGGGSDGSRAMWSKCETNGAPGREPTSAPAAEQGQIFFCQRTSTAWVRFRTLLKCTPPALATFKFSLLME
jgi:hypothetical protein